MTRRSRLCTSLSAHDCGEMAKKAGLAISLGSDLVEFRIDRLTRPSASQVLKHLSPFFKRAVVTVRSPSEGGSFKGSEKQRIELLAALAAESPAYVDIELRTIEKNVGLPPIPAASQTIVSWHSARGTPPLARLREAATEAMKCGGLAKIVTAARRFDDCIRLLSLYKGRTDRRLVAFCTGEFGLASRIIALQLGCPLLYCSLPGEPLVEGQAPIGTIRQLTRLVRA